MSKRTPAPAEPVPGILARAFADGRGTMSPAVARQILRFGFGQADQDRMADLAERNQSGALSPAEQAELMEYVDAGHILSTLHSLAHLALKPAQTAKG
ncbi:MAG: hypothetical protein J2P46_03280 [Zavarzinella sp.]|nr:hypothetical protein [Zavarzinella sp.]